MVTEELAKEFEPTAQTIRNWVEQADGDDAKLLSEIRAIHERSRGTYGAPRIHAELHDAGIRVGHNRVVRQMREAGLVGVSRRKWLPVHESGVGPVKDQGQPVRCP